MIVFHRDVVENAAHGSRTGVVNLDSMLHYLKPACSTHKAGSKRSERSRCRCLPEISDHAILNVQARAGGETRCRSSGADPIEQHPADIDLVGRARVDGDCVAPLVAVTVAQP